VSAKRFLDVRSFPKGPYIHAAGNEEFREWLVITSEDVALLQTASPFAFLPRISTQSFINLSGTSVRRCIKLPQALDILVLTISD